MSLKLGIQMYSVKNAMKKDPIATIAKVAGMGYRYIELANLNADKDPGCGFGVEPEDLNAAIAGAGAKIISAHIDPFDKENVDRVIEYHKKLGTQALMSKSIDVTYDGVLRQCELLNYIGHKCEEAGIFHCLHTGAIPVYEDGKDVLEVYEKNTDEGTLFFEFDTYWSLRSGLDPVQMIKKHKDRIVMIHLKDIPRQTGSPLNVLEHAPLDYDGFMEYYLANVGSDDFVEIGQGIMDIQSIIDATIEFTKSQYIILEQDFTKLDEFESLALSMEGLKKLKNLELV